MNEPALKFVASQLGYQAPGLLVAVIALVLAVAFMRQAPTPSLLTLVGAGILLATAVGVTVGQALLIDAGPGMRSEWMTVLSIGASLLRALGIGLFVAAIFTGRNQSPAADAAIYGPPEKLYPPPYPPQPYPPQPYPPQYPAPR